MDVRRKRAITVDQEVLHRADAGEIFDGSVIDLRPDRSAPIVSPPAFDVEQVERVLPPVGRSEKRRGVTRELGGGGRISLFRRVFGRR